MSLSPVSGVVIGFVNNPSTNSTDWATSVAGLGAGVNSNVNFNAHPLGALNSTQYLISDGVTLTGSTGANTIQSGAGPAQGNTTGAIPGEGVHPASNFLFMETPGGGNSLIVSFATPVFGAGLFIVDRFHGPGFTNDIAIEAYSGANGTGVLLGSFSGLNSNFQNNGLYFMGIVSTAGDIGSIRLVRSNDTAGDDIGVDDILFSTGGGSVVPEPGSLLLLSSGIGALALLRLRKRQ